MVNPSRENERKKTTNKLIDQNFSNGYPTFIVHVITETLYKRLTNVLKHLGIGDIPLSLESTKN